VAFQQINGAELYSEVAGDGEPVLLLHGGFCSLEAFRTQSDALVADHRVFAFERPGHGRSADVDGPFGYAASVADTLAYMDANGLESAHLVGYSDGAIIGLMMSVEHPRRVRSLVAISGNLDPSGFSHAAEAEGALVLDAPAAAPIADDAPSVERMLYNRLSPDGPDHADVVLEKLVALWTSEPRIEPSSLRAITAPTLVMSGDRDSIRPDHSLLIASSIPGARLAIVPGASHGLVAEHPELVSLLIRGFLRDVERR